MLKVGRRGQALPVPAAMAAEKYRVTRKGETQLSKLYYVWKADNAPTYDRSFDGKPLVVGETKVAKGFGVKGRSAFMFMADGRARRFRAVVAVNRIAKADGAARFRVQSEDFFANKVLWDSGKMTADSAPKEIDIDVKDVQCLMLVFEGEGAFGTWAEPRVTADGG